MATTIYLNICTISVFSWAPDPEKLRGKGKKQKLYVIILKTRKLFILSRYCFEYSISFFF